MGCGRSIPFVVNNDIPGQDQQAFEVLCKLNLNQSDMNKIYTFFRYIDNDNSGMIKAAEIFAYFNLIGSPLELKIFQLFDEDNSGELNFVEFVCSMWHFLSLETDNLALFVFTLYRPSGEGQLSMAEIKDLVETLHNKKLDSNPTLSSITKELFNSPKFTGTCGCNLFCKWANDNKFILTPLTLLQIKFRKQLISEKFWQTMMKTRQTDSRMKSPTFFREIQTEVRLRHENEMRKSELQNRVQDGKARRARQSKMAKNQSFVMDALNVRRASVQLAESVANFAKGAAQKRGTIVRKKPEGTPRAPRKGRATAVDASTSH